MPETNPSLAFDMHAALAAPWLIVAVGALAAPAASLSLQDRIRGREVPVEIHEPAAAACRSNCPVVLFGAGYRAHPSEYSFLLAALAEAGFFVVGVQHDLAQDPPMPSTGDATRDRTPFWERGMVNLEFAQAELSRRFPSHDWTRVILAGHSQGGDIAARLAARPGYPVRALVTLDNRRAPLPKGGHPPVLTIRSADQPADPGVIPDLADRTGPRFCLVRLGATRHDDMNNAADPPGKARITGATLAFLLRDRCEGDT